MKLDEFCGRVALQGPFWGPDHSSGLNSPGIEVPTSLLPSGSQALYLLRIGQRQNMALSVCRRRCVLEEGGAPILPWLP